MKDRSVLLIVDDQSQNIELLEAHLIPQGYEIVSATNGIEALDILSKTNIDLILSDVMMPVMDGFEFTRKVRSDGPNPQIPIILVTALREKEDRVRGIEAGCDDFITKPVDKHELIARVKSLLKVKAYNDLRNNYQTELESEIAQRTEELKKSFEENKVLEHQLFQSQKMEAIGRLAGGVAHDFNNILQVIQGFTDHILTKTPEEDPRLAWLKQIRVACDKAAALVQRLLSFSRNQAQNKIVLNLNTVLTDIATMLQQLLGERIELILDFSPSLSDIEADRTQIDMVLMNLSANARDAMSEGGKLSWKTSNVTLPTGAYVLLSVRDTGTGMDEETMNHMFEPFYTTKAIGKGTGLGLATVYGVVKQAGGTIECSSSPGKGTEFRIYLPRFSS
ncbi:MAG: response regulator [Treponemataceae bacterium]